MPGGKGIIVKVVEHLFREAAVDVTKDGAKAVVKDTAKTTARTGLRDLAGRAKQFAKRVLTKDPIDVATGEVVLHHTDLSLPGILPLVLERTHLSSYRAGRLFGTSWASTLDQHLEVDSRGVCFAAADGDILSYPHPQPDMPAYALNRPHWPLERTDTGGYTLTDPQTGRTLHFPPSFGGVHDLAAITDRNGHRIDIERNETGIPVLVRHSGGYRVAVDSADGRIIGLRLLSNEPDLTLIRYGYDEAGNLARVVNSSGLPLRLTYDEQSRLTGWQDRNGFWYHYVYDEQGRGIRGRGTDGRLNATLTDLAISATLVVARAPWLGRDEP